MKLAGRIAVVITVYEILANVLTVVAPTGRETAR